MKRSTNIILLFLLALVVLASAIACTSNDEADPLDRKGEDDDETGNDDDADDDSGDDDAVEPQGIILAPQNLGLYQTKVPVNLADELGENDSFLLDEQAVNLYPTREIDAADGTHTLSLVRNGELADQVTFEIQTDGNRTEPRTITDPLPQTIELEYDGGPLELIKLRVENRGDAVETLRIAAGQQPDLQRSPEEIIEQIAEETADDRERAIQIFNWVGGQVISHPPAIDYFYDLAYPFLLTVFGYGECGNFADLLCRLFDAAGFDQRIQNLDGHIVSEVCWDGDCDVNSESWHIFDAHSGLYVEDFNTGAIYSIEALVAQPSRVWQKYDQEESYRLSNDPAYFEQALLGGSTIGERDFSVVNPGPGIDMASGDILTFFPRGVMARLEYSAEDHPILAVGNGILERDLLLSSEAQSIEIPFAIDRAVVVVSNVQPEKASGTITVDVLAEGMIEGETEVHTTAISREINSSAGTLAVDLKRAFDDSFGLITNYQIALTTDGVSMESGRIHTLFQCSQRLIQLSELDRELIVRGNAPGDVDLRLTVETFQGADAFAPVEGVLVLGQETSCSADTSKAMAARAFAAAFDAEDRFAGGAKATLECDGDVEVSQVTTAGVDKTGSIASPRDYLARNLWMEWQTYQTKQFWLESATPGTVACELILNDEPTGEMVTVTYY